MHSGKVSRVLLFLKNMVYESTSPMEILRFAKYYRKKGLDVVVVLWGPMGVILAKKGKRGAPPYDERVRECMDLGVKFKCCELASAMIGFEKGELIEGVEMIQSFEVADLMMQYCEEGQLVINL
ncbi:MAG: DsrE family protein [Candidatus Methanoperedens sp.]|nr:DsrE family protein [Candidatus Methanoperedens sp.]MCZ7360136.1 DsrE family protein [Candidatus Methanoperedens sp.]HLB70702.1 DsrE family protein [Candidatus Methanoperedens sp.]